jgi:mitochondrial GTPase 1
MSAFMKNLPTLLSRTDIVLELRDSRLPLTSINPNFESHVRQWRGDTSVPSDATTGLRERVIVFNKMDLVPSWGMTVASTLLVL